MSETIGVTDLPPSLKVGRVYSFAEIAAAFSFSTDYLRAQGGMIPRPNGGPLLLRTHPRGGYHIDYGDLWDGDELIYTGRGQHRDQTLTGRSGYLNGDVATNRRLLYVVEAAGTQQLRFLGRAACTEYWQEEAPDREDKIRQVYKFRLSFDAAAPRRTPAIAVSADRWRAFDRGKPPKPPSSHNRRRSAEETRALMEKAAAGHHELLVALADALEGAAWTDIREMPSAIDLAARSPSGASVLFEAKTIRPRTLVPRTRTAVAQLLEYRFFHGESTDHLVVVTNASVPATRKAWLDSLGLDLLWIEGKKVKGAPRHTELRPLTES